MPRKKKVVAERVVVTGARPATFKLVEKASESFDLFRSSAKIGTARREPDGVWTARFDGLGASFRASGRSAPELLNLVGRYVLLGEAREAAARPLEEKHPDTKVKGKKSAEQALSIKLLRLGEERRLAGLDAEIEALQKSVRRAPRK